MRMTASWSGPMDLPNTRLRRDDPRPMASSPLIVPDRVKRAVVLGAVKVWPGVGGACGKGWRDGQP